MLIDRLEHQRHRTNIDLLLARFCDLADPAAAPVLLTSARAGDDFHRLKALKGLLKVGDGRAMEIAPGMVEETRKPVRRDASRLITVTQATLVSRMLQESRH
jgi:hypothetical protein